MQLDRAGILLRGQRYSRRTSWFSSTLRVVVLLEARDQVCLVASRAERLLLQQLLELGHLERSVVGHDARRCLVYWLSCWFCARDAGNAVEAVVVGVHSLASAFVGSYSVSACDGGYVVCLFKYED